MLDLSRLKVSLTKHGAHKVGQLLVKYGSKLVLDNVIDTDLNIDINLAQAKKNLSAYKGTVPKFWDDILKEGPGVLNGSVLVAIIFSHHELIQAMSISCGTDQKGTLTGTSFTGRKAFTNFKNDLYELGYAIEYDAAHVVYDLSPLIKNAVLGKYVRTIIEHKLNHIGWDGKTSVIDVIQLLKLNEVFGLSIEEISSWFNGQGHAEEFEVQESEIESIVPFVFRPGHNAGKHTGRQKRSKVRSGKSILLHNFLQTRLYEQLCDTYTSAKVGTEIPTGSGESFVDVCVELDSEEFVFYEIKTNRVSRRNVREALSQIMDYAYWPSECRASKLIIIGPAQADEHTKSYMKLLREQYMIPVFYRYIDAETGDVSVDEF